MARGTTFHRHPGGQPEHRYAKAPHATAGRVRDVDTDQCRPPSIRAPTTPLRLVAHVHGLAPTLDDEPSRNLPPVSPDASASPLKPMSGLGGGTGDRAPDRRGGSGWADGRTFGRSGDRTAMRRDGVGDDPGSKPAVASPRASRRVARAGAARRERFSGHHQPGSRASVSGGWGRECPLCRKRR